MQMAKAQIRLQGPLCQFTESLDTVDYINV